MLITLLNGKIHRATVTQTDVDYVGSVTVDTALLEAAGIREYERVQVVDVTNGARLETYAIAADAHSGIVCLNGAAAHLVECGDLVIIMSYCQVTPEEAQQHQPSIVFVDGNNAITETAHCEKHAQISP